jgi:hypothetical protein
MAYRDLQPSLDSTSPLRNCDERTVLALSQQRSQLNVSLKLARPKWRSFCETTNVIGRAFIRSQNSATRCRIDRDVGCYRPLRLARCNIDLRGAVPQNIHDQAPGSTAKKAVGRTSSPSKANGSLQLFPSLLTLGLFYGQSHARWRIVASATDIW